MHFSYSINQHTQFWSSQSKFLTWVLLLWQFGLCLPYHITNIHVCCDISLTAASFPNHSTDRNRNCNWTYMYWGLSSLRNDVPDWKHGNEKKIYFAFYIFIRLKRWMLLRFITKVPSHFLRNDCDTNSISIFQNGFNMVRALLEYCIAYMERGWNLPKVTMSIVESNTNSWFHSKFIVYQLLLQDHILVFIDKFQGKNDDITRNHQSDILKCFEESNCTIIRIWCCQFIWYWANFVSCYFWDFWHSFQVLQI